MTDIDALTNKSKKVIDTIEYIDLATITEDGKPWNSPLWFVRDDKYNLYFYSPKYTQHSENIRNNGNGFVVIYDSRAPEGTGFGVYMTVEVKELNTVSEVDEALKWVYKKRKRKGHRRSFWAIPLEGFTRLLPRRPG